VADAPQANISSPAGSIYLDDLIEHYLVSFGFRLSSSPWLGPSEYKQYACESVLRVIETRGLKNVSPEQFWEWARYSNSEDRIWLIPDTEAGARFQQESKEKVVIFNGVTNVTAYVCEIFKHLVWKDLGSERRLIKLKEEVSFAYGPSEWRHAPSGDGRKPIMDLPDYGTVSQEQEEEKYYKIVERAYATMKTRDVEVVKLILLGNRQAEVAEAYGMTIHNVRKILAKFRDRCRRARRKA
jgi:DNA-directed RNA polymerase specialized sigma24 family protein